MATKVIKATLRFKRGTAAEWITINPVLKLGEPGYVTDLNKLKVGNGQDVWTELPYLAGGGTESIAADNKSLEIYLNDDTPTLRIKDFNEAEAGEIPQKTVGGSIEWVNISDFMGTISETEIREICQ